MKRILFVYHVSSIGGGSFCLLNILKELDRDVVKPIVLLCKDGPLAEEIRKLGIDVFFLDGLRTVPYNSSIVRINSLRNGISLIKSFSSFSKLIKNLRIDAVYLNTMMLYPYLRVIKNNGLTSLIHIREHWPKEEHIIQRKLAINHIKKYADKIIAINSYSASMLEERAKDVTIVYDWIDMESRDNHSSMSDVLGEDAQNLKVFLYTGGLQPIKGALEIVNSFIDNVKDSNARLLAVGLIKPGSVVGIRGFIKAMLNKCGFRTYSQKLFDKIDTDRRIVCIPSNYMITSILKQSYCYLSYFTIPHANLALAECIILNIPGIAAETPESIEYSDNGALALLFPMNNYQAFCNKLKCVNDFYPGIRKRLESRAYNVKKMFDKERNVNILNSLIETI